MNLGSVSGGARTAADNTQLHSMFADRFVNLMCIEEVVSMKSTRFYGRGRRATSVLHVALSSVILEPDQLKRLCKDS